MSSPCFGLADSNQNSAKYRCEVRSIESVLSALVLLMSWHPWSSSYHHMVTWWSLSKWCLVLPGHWSIGHSFSCNMTWLLINNIWTLIALLKILSCLVSVARHAMYCEKKGTSAFWWFYVLFCVKCRVAAVPPGLRLLRRCEGKWTQFQRHLVSETGTGEQCTQLSQHHTTPATLRTEQIITRDGSVAPRLWVVTHNKELNNHQSWKQNGLNGGPHFWLGSRKTLLHRRQWWRSRRCALAGSHGCAQSARIRDSSSLTANSVFRQLSPAPPGN